MTRAFSFVSTVFLIILLFYFSFVTTTFVCLAVCPFVSDLTWLWSDLVSFISVGRSGVFLSYHTGEEGMGYLRYMEVCTDKEPGGDLEIFGHGHGYGPWGMAYGIWEMRYEPRRSTLFLRAFAFGFF